MHGKRILIGISGGIAAYKIPLLVRLLKKSGAEVKCVMTNSAKEFVTKEVLSALSDNIVYDAFWDQDDGTWNNHVDLGIWADLFVIAPLTANTLSKMSSGTCDNVLLASYFSLRKKCIVFPAMDLDMYTHESVKRNVKQIESDGVIVIPAATGDLASGLSGQGRMSEPGEIYKIIQDFLLPDAILKGKKILITAGPTYESIDPVRFIGNHSSGKMGYALANSFANKGANVTLISGPTNLDIQSSLIDIYQITSAKQMFELVQQKWNQNEIGVFAAAVADYTPKKISDSKIKKSKDNLQIDLIKTTDILNWAGQNKKPNQKLIGFALETNDPEENALKKLNKKNLDAIVLNSLADKGAGFGFDTNKVTILDKSSNKLKFDLLSKDETANNIVTYIEQMYK